MKDDLGGPGSLRCVQIIRNLLITPVRYGFRSFDRQWLIPDARLINRPNPTLWKAYSDRQIYLTAPRLSPSSGPAATITGLIPDLHHYQGRLVPCTPALDR